MTHWRPEHPHPLWSALGLGQEQGAKMGQHEPAGSREAHLLMSSWELWLLSLSEVELGAHTDG